MKKPDEGKLWVFNIERFAIHDGPGIRTVVFLQGCPLRCQWCANPESWECGVHIFHSAEKCTGCGRCVQGCPYGAIRLTDTPNGDRKAVLDREKCQRCGRCADVCMNGANQISGREMSLNEICEAVIRDKDYYDTSGGGVTFSGGEAAFYADQLMPLLEKLSLQKISIAFETCGNVPISKLIKAASYADVILYDLKSLDAKRLKQYTGGDLKLTLSNLSQLAAQVPEKIILRMPVIPGFNDKAKNVEKVFETASSLGINRVDLLPYHTLGLIKYRQLGIEYPFPCMQGISPKELRRYIQSGREKGIEVNVGG